MIEKGAVLPMFYLAPVEYFSVLNSYKPAIVIEKEENFLKQTYRNRANIYSPEGILTLVVPVVKGSKSHTKTKDVRISYDFRWQRLHWQSLQACYRRSAYFEYYEDDIVKFYENRYDFLFDYNEQLLAFLNKAVKLNIEPGFTEDYEKDYPLVVDYRNSIHPKKDSGYNQKKYFQVFEDRKGFLQNLSIIDLLFNQGPHSINYL